MNNIKKCIILTGLFLNVRLNALEHQHITVITAGAGIVSTAATSYLYSKYCPKRDGSWKTAAKILACQSGAVLSITAATGLAYVVSSQHHVDTQLLSMQACVEQLTKYADQFKREITEKLTKLAQENQTCCQVLADTEKALDEFILYCKQQTELLVRNFELYKNEQDPILKEQLFNEYKEKLNQFAEALQNRQSSTFVNSLRYIATVSMDTAKNIVNETYKAAEHLAAGCNEMYEKLNTNENRELAKEIAQKAKEYMNKTVEMAKNVWEKIIKHGDSPSSK